MFQIALKAYLKLKDAEEKAKPGIDQKKVLGAMQVARGTLGMKFAYFTNQ